MTAKILWTIGHSTHPLEQFLALLASYHIQRLVDVRLIPYSRRNPHYNSEALRGSVEAVGIRYQTLPGLGGRRKSRPDSPNVGWRNASFRGYADHMQTPAFHQALAQLMRMASEERTSIMCAEALPWRCHRTLIADAVTAQGWEVRHIMSRAQAQRHVLTTFASVQGDRITYPGGDETQAKLL